jgi:sugar O-acyltransferase (sialic acid O-acetyltransferase NeuD family)
MKKALFGFGGHASEVASQMGMDLTFFVDDEFCGDFTRPISSFDPHKFEIMIAISDPKLRESIVKKLPKETKYYSFIHPTALLMDSDTIEIGIGSFIGAYSILTNNIKIGEHSILNRGNHIGHGTTIGNFLSMMPGAIISGDVTVGNRAYLGTNSTIIEKKKICDDVILGANSVTIRDITKPGTYVGVPSNLKNSIYDIT